MDQTASFTDQAGRRFSQIDRALQGIHCQVTFFSFACMRRAAHASGMTTAIGFTRYRKLRSDMREQDHVAMLSRTRASVFPSVVPAHADAQNRTRRCNRNASPRCIDQRKTHRLVSCCRRRLCLWGKEGSCFFKRSPSARSNSFSRRNRASSWPTSSCGPANKAASSTCCQETMRQLQGRPPPVVSFGRWSPEFAPLPDGMLH